MFTLLPLSASVAGNSKNNNNSKPSLCLSTLPTSLSLHRHSNAKYAINKREPCEFLSKCTLPLSLSPSRTAYALSTCIHACMPTWLHVQLVYVRVCGYTPHIAFIAWRSLCCVVAVGVLVPLRHWPNKRADWLKISYDSVSQKRKCAKDPENEIIKQKTSARPEKRTNVVVSTADSLRLTSCHVVSFRFVCSRSRSLYLSFALWQTRSLTTCWAFWPSLCSLRRLRSINLVALTRPGPVRPSPRNPKLLSIISFGYSRTLIRTNAVKREITEMLKANARSEQSFLWTRRPTQVGIEY